MRLKLDLHPIFNDSHRIEEALQAIIEEAVTKPGTLHEAYSRFWNYSLGNQILALIQCRDRGIEPGPLASFNRPALSLCSLVGYSGRQQ